MMKKIYIISSRNDEKNIQKFFLKSITYIVFIISAVHNFEKSIFEILKCFSKFGFSAKVDWTIFLNKVF